MNGHTIRMVGDSQRQHAHRMIDAAPVGSVVNIREGSRTLAQNAKFHAMVSDICRAKPQGRILPTDIWKVLILAACGHKMRFEPSLEGEGVVPVGLRSSRLTVAQMSEAIEYMYSKTEEWSITWSEPRGDS